MKLINIIMINMNVVLVYRWGNIRGVSLYSFFMCFNNKFIMESDF